MSIQNLEDKIKFTPSQAGPDLLPETVSFNEAGQVEKKGFVRRFFFGLLLVLVGVLSFGVGRLTTLSNKSAVRIEFDPNLGELSTYQGEGLDKTASVNQAVLPALSTNGEIFASSKGKKYYYPGCKSTISEKNKITFKTKEMAESAGYTLAANCKPR